MHRSAWDDVVNIVKEQLRHCIGVNSRDVAGEMHYKWVYPQTLREPIGIMHCIRLSAMTTRI